MTALFDGSNDTISQGVTFGTDLAQATLDTDGVFFTACVYVASAPGATVGLFHAGDGSFTNLAGAITNAATGQPRAYWSRGGGPDQVSSGNALVAGWNLVTVWLREGTTAGRRSLTVYHNGFTVAELLNEVASIVMDLHTTLYLGSIGSGNYLSGEMCGIGAGTGNPAAMHAWLWNSGSIREVDAYDFASDPDATLEHYWPFDKEGTDTIDNTDTEVQDTVGSLSTWSYSGAPTWSTRAAPFNGGETGTLGTPALTDATSLSITVTLPSNNWGTVTVDTSKMFHWAIKGFGFVEASSVSVSGEGTSQITLDVTLSRDVYSVEDLIASYEEGWCVDDAGNSALSAEDVSVTVTNGAANGLTTAHTGCSYKKMAWQFDTAKRVCFTRLGFPGFVVGGDSVDLTASYPIETGTTPNRYNGAQINPLGDDKQGFDERDTNTYDNTLRVTYPVTVSANDVIIKQIGRTDPAATPASTAIFTDYDGYGACFILSEALPEDAFEPTIVGYDGTKARPYVRLTDTQLDAIAAGLPTYSTVGLVDSNTDPVTKPPAADLLYRIAQLNLGRTLSTSAAAYYRRLVPLRWTAQDGYHRYNQETLGTIVTALCADYTPAEKRPIVEWVIHHGLQWYEAQKENGNGAIRAGNQGHFAPTALALLWTGRGGEIDDIAPICGGKEYMTTYKWTQDDLDGLVNHTADVALAVGDNRRLHYKEKEVTGVSGANITCGNMGVQESEPEYDDMLLTDGVGEWAITGYNDSTKTFTLETSGHGLSVSDTVWAKLKYTPTLGDADWGRFHLGGDGAENLPSRSGGSASWRRDFERYGGAHFALQATGCRNLVNHPAFFEYVERQNAGDQPTGGQAFPNSWDVWYGDVTSDAGAVFGRAVNFIEAMILEHGDSLASVEQFESPPPIPGATGNGGDPRLPSSFRMLRSTRRRATERLWR